MYFVQQSHHFLQDGGISFDGVHRERRWEIPRVSPRDTCRTGTCARVGRALSANKLMLSQMAIIFFIYPLLLIYEFTNLITNLKVFT